MSALLFVDLFVDQYADFTFLYDVWLAGGTAVDFTGCTASLVARTHPSDPTPAVSISTTPSTDGSVVLGPVTLGPTGSVPAGCVQVNIANARTAKFGPAPMRYDLLITFSNGEKFEFATGQIRAKAGSNY